VHEFGLQYGCVFYFSKKTQRREKVPVNWELRNHATATLL